MSQKIAKPFLKWAGGKTQLLHDIENKFPYQKDDTLTYIEPFVGAGSVLFWVLNHFPNIKTVVINDINEDLIQTYQIIKNNVQALIPLLKEWENEYHQLVQKKEYYYAKRTLFNTRHSDAVTQTALFIFLNKTCFNGLYRVNKKNHYNVPIGSYKTPLICDEENLYAVNQALKKVEILNGDFEHTIDFITKNTVFYLDPPYKPLSQSSSFKAYSQYDFNDQAQIRLKEFCDTLDAKNCKWILSNSDVKSVNPNNHFFDDLYEKYHINRVSAKRNINANPTKRVKLTESLIAN